MTPGVCRSPGCTRRAATSFWCANHYRRVDYWIRTGHLHPDQPTAGSGINRDWPDTELAIADRIVQLTDAGVALRPAAQIARHDPDNADVIVTILTRQPEAAA